MGRLFWKILITFWLTLLFAGGATALTVWLHQRSLNAISQDLVMRPASVLAVRAAATTYQYGGEQALRAMLQEQRSEAPENLQIYAVDADGNELLGRDVSAATLQNIRDSVDRGLMPPIAREQASAQPGGKRYLLFAPKLGQLQRRHVHNRMPPPRFSGMVLISSGVIGSFVSSFLLAWYFSRPIRSLRGAFRRLANGDLSQRIAPAMGRRRDEIADLGRDFDDMAGKLQSLMASQRRLLHDVSHELRSPLARLQVSIGLARQQPARVAESLERIELEARRLETLVGEVLTLSRLESGVPQRMDEYLDLLELLEAVIDDARFEAQALQREVLFECQVESLPLLRGHGELLYRAIENVVRNALHHTPAGTQVRLTLALDQTRSEIVINVDDAGAGVAEAELGRIFEAFQRSSSESKGGAGYGLGLAIARRAVETHGGSITAQNRPQGGLRVQIRLPQALSQAH